MNEIVNPVELAQRNLDEADRQLKQAESDVKSGAISRERYRQFEHLREICSEDLQRVIREN
ncbi:hypothetical protein [Arthrobacter russicus]|jgi:outer membrane protein TolC|uniref:Outer membrane protein TolC n=1 Tax=Arthrobacter russicus TaxID=172040 RepID=A0ABU1J6Y4_9MICC|nr:hypothetical protein [Arthrobacter russicus]MDR6268177.1 outer membrane protein TolC [Arthrobacter russicus]